MMNGPKSREETPKEGSDTHQRCIPHCTNIAPHRTKYKPFMLDEPLERQLVPERNKVLSRPAEQETFGIFYMDLCRF